MRNFLSPKIILLFCLFVFTISEAQESKQQTGLAISANSKYGAITMTVKEFKTCKFSVQSFNKSGPQNIEILEFTIKYPGKKSIIVKGNKLTNGTLLALGKIEVGAQITISDARTSLKSFCNMMSPLIITLRP